MHGRLRDEVRSRDDSPTCLDTVLGGWLAKHFKRVSAVDKKI